MEATDGELTALYDFAEIGSKALFALLKEKDAWAVLGLDELEKHRLAKYVNSWGRDE